MESARVAEVRELMQVFTEMGFEAGAGLRYATGLVYGMEKLVYQGDEFLHTCEVMLNFDDRQVTEEQFEAVRQAFAAMGVRIEAAKGFGKFHLYLDYRMDGPMEALWMGHKDNNAFWETLRRNGGCHAEGGEKGNYSTCTTSASDIVSVR